MICKIKQYLNKKDTECTTPRCDMCWYREKYDDLVMESKMVRREIEEECGKDIWE